MRGPAIISSKSILCLKSGQFDAFVHTDIKAHGDIEYTYLMNVYDGNDIAFIVSSEVAAEYIDNGSHFLCAFDENGHHNFGSDDKYGDLQEFLGAASHLLQQRSKEPVKLQHDPSEIN